MKKIIFLNIFLSFFAAEILAQNTTVSDENDCNNEIFLPQNIFKYKGQGSRNIWIGMSKLPNNLNSFLDGLTKRIFDIIGENRASKENHFHITIKFLGSVGPSPCAQNAINNALSKMPVFPMKLKPQRLKILRNNDGSVKHIAVSYESPNIKLFGLSLENAMQGFADRSTRPLWVHTTIIHEIFRGPKLFLTDEEEEQIENMNIQGGTFTVNGFELLQSGKYLRVLGSFGK